MCSLSARLLRTRNVPSRKKGGGKPHFLFFFPDTGVTPKKGGTTHIGLPVFNTVKEAKAAGMPRAQKKIRK